METKDTIFLSVDEAREAVCLDLQRYEPQLMLLGEILRVISKDRAVIKKERGKAGRWVAANKGSKMVWLDGHALCLYVCDVLKAESPGIDTMAAICSRVFQERATPAVDPETGEQGISIETGMENFTCIQCGNCCKSLDYHDALTENDVNAWRNNLRRDILAWIGVYESKDGQRSYRIWTDPRTGKIAETCPFLKHLPAENRWVCRIHEVKPSICREYPVSRKHGIMTGCPGFSPE